MYLLSHFQWQNSSLLFSETNYCESHGQGKEFETKGQQYHIIHTILDSLRKLSRVHGFHLGTDIYFAKEENEIKIETQASKSFTVKLFQWIEWMS